MMSHSDLLLIAFFLLPAVALAGFVLLYRRRGERHSGAARVVLGNLLLLVFLAGLFVAGGEIYYRFIFDQTDGYHITRTSVRWMERHYQRNDRGVRDDVDYAGADDPGRMRVTFLGDSYTNGHGVKQVADRFVNRIRADRPGWEVHSFAEDGMDTGPILDRVRRLTATGYQLDVVVYVYCVNDISDLIPEWAAAAGRLYDEPPGYLVRHSFVINTWYYRLRISRDPELTGYFDRIAESYSGPPWELQARRLRALHERVVVAGGRLLVVGFPSSSIAWTRCSTRRRPGWPGCGPN